MAVIVELKIRKYWFILKLLLRARRWTALRRFLRTFCLRQPMLFTPKSPPQFELARFRPEVAAALFRFDSDDIAELSVCLQLPEWIMTRHRVQIPRIECMCLVLCRMAYPCRWVELVPIFHRDASVLSHAFQLLVRRIVATWHGLLLFPKTKFTKELLLEIAQSVNAQGFPFATVYGSIDGTCRPICRPVRDQDVYYNGMIRQHCIKFLCVTLFNGVIAFASGPHAGIRHDARIFTEHFRPRLEEDQHFFHDDGTPLCVLADAGTPCLQFQFIFLLIVCVCST
jgi:hypothetical protein